ncbi:hypothetical protein GOP47_0006721 [Adiantum capillus-veneris]|uniref:Uncharacterized protein n=1 Tax=Adiantum capillus-veneris TaxID=13818 RepID=A0A9D4V3F1_ADICA|nr:hypothetical protein GOP47_0006721 [Adiantum capillus-veneris]
MQVVAGGVEPNTSTALHGSSSGMAHYRAMIMQVPTRIRAALEPSISNGMCRSSHISLLRSLRPDFYAQPQLPCFSFECRLTPFIQNFHCRASIAAPSEAGTHATVPDYTEDHVNMRRNAGHSVGRPQAQGADAMSPEFAEALQAFDNLHAQLQASRMLNKMDQTQLHALEASLSSMEAVMSKTSLHEYWQMGSAWLKLAWLYSDAPNAIEEPVTRVIASGHHALKFLEALQTPVWTIVSCCYVLGHAYMESKRFEDSIYHLEKAASTIKALEAKGQPNPEQTQLVNAVHILLPDAKLHFGQHLCTRVRDYLGGDKDSQPFLSRVTEALELVNAKTDPDSMAMAAEHENCLGIFYLQSQQANEALPHFKNSLSKITRVHGQGNSKVAIAHNHLGVAYTELCKINDALKHFESAKKILSKCTLEKGDGTEVTLYNNIAQVYALRGRFDDAITAQKRLIVIIKQNMKDNIQTPFHLDAAEETLHEMMQQVNQTR